LGYSAHGWASGQGKFVFGPVDFGVVEPQPIISQDEIVISNVCDIELGTFFMGSSQGILQLEVLDCSVADHTICVLRSVYILCWDGFSPGSEGQLVSLGVVFVDDESFSTAI